jgi:DNA ligase (NAD+)
MSIADIRKLEKKIDDANELYHTFGDSGLSDAEYDSLLGMLEKLDPKNKRIKKKKVGASVATNSPDKWTKFKHDTFKMGSQSKITTLEGLETWAAKLSGEEFVIEHKLDGTSIKLIYEKGKLVMGATRGDGDEGEDITSNVLKMNGVPVTIKDPRRIVFRGEILLYKSNLATVGGKNCRNSAAGAAKKLNGENCQHLNVKIYSVMNWKELGLKTVLDVVRFINTNSLDPVFMNGPFKSLKEIEKFKDEYEKKTRQLLDFDIDGLIIQTNRLEEDDWDYPTRSIAYKFAAGEGVTKLIDVEWRDTGGRIAPRAVLDPIDVGGVTITHATLNNIEHINRLGVKIGDLVVVSRRNDVIPAIEKVSIASATGKPIVAPTHDKDGFPIVHEKNALGEELVHLVSTNPNSRAKIVRSIMSWYRSHGAKGVAGETVEAILDADAATDLPSFYELGLKGSDKLLEVEHFGAGKFKVLKQATLLTSKTNVLTFMNAMDLQGFSDTRFAVILEHYGREMELDEFLQVCCDTSAISAISGFGENTAKSLYNEIKEATPLIKKMSALVEIEKWSPSKKASAKINGLSFCFTGSMSFDREVLEKAVKKHSGIVAGVSKKLDYLVANKGWESGKTKKATDLGIKRITEQEFMDMIGGDIE